MEGPRSSWQRRLPAEPGRVYRRLPAARLPASPPWAAQAGQFQLLMLSRFPALGPGGGPAHCSHPRRLAPLSGHETQLSWEGLSPAPWGPQTVSGPSTPFRPSFQASTAEMMQLPPGVAESQRGVALSLGKWWRVLLTVSRVQARELGLPQRQARLCIGCADSLPGRMAQW